MSVQMVENVKKSVLLVLLVVLVRLVEVLLWVDNVQPHVVD